MGEWRTDAWVLGISFKIGEREMEFRCDRMCKKKKEEKTKKEEKMSKKRFSFVYTLFEKCKANKFIDNIMIDWDTFHSRRMFILVF